MSVEIRAARPDEVERVLALYDWLFAPPGCTPAGWPSSRAAVALRQAIESHDALVLIAESDQGDAVGLCVAYQDIHSVRFGQRAWVEDLAVHPDHRSRRLGGRLLDAAKDWARERGATHLELDTGEAREDAQRFYDRQGKSHRGISYSWEL